MSVYAVIEIASGRIVNRIILDPATDWSVEGGFEIVQERLEPLQIGGRIVDGVYSPPESEPLPELPSVRPMSITRRQFFQQLAVMGEVSWEEAEAAMGTTIPQPLLALLDQIPFDLDQLRDARMLIIGATEFQRHHQLTYLVGYMYGWNDTQIDQLFHSAALL